MRLPVIDRYVLREILATWAAVTLVLLVILFTNSLAYMLSKVVEGDISGHIVLPLFLTNVAAVVVMVIPLGLYLALLLTFGRLYADSEMAALGACGVGMARLLRPALVAGLIAAIVTAVLTIWASPWAKRVEHELRGQVAATTD
jgi:lipopolysaccharide export system permease protein